jgi:hypothetical protein
VFWKDLERFGKEVKRKCQNMVMLSSKTGRKMKETSEVYLQARRDLLGTSASDKDSA